MYHYKPVTCSAEFGAGGTKAGGMWLFTTFASPVWGMKWGLCFLPLAVTIIHFFGIALRLQKFCSTSP